MSSSSAPSSPPSSSRLSSASVTLSGIAGSAGISVGPAVVIEPRRVSYVRRLLKRDEVSSEFARFQYAVQGAQAELRAMAEERGGAVGRAEDNILEAYVSMLGDELLAQAVEHNIRLGRQCAEWAVSNAIASFAASLSARDDAYLRERSRDFEFIGDQLLLALTGTSSERLLPRGIAPAIFLAHDLSPTDLMALGKHHVLGIATEVGTKTSHTAILARALGIPAVLGVPELLERVVSGDALVIDGLRGIITVHPTEEMVQKGLLRGERYQALTRHLLGSVGNQAEMASGERVHLFANIELSAEATYAIEHGAEGIGLYRTEFLYMDRATLPSEEEQLEQYITVAREIADRPVTFRTFDFGGDKAVHLFPCLEERNPALGLRAVRLALAQPDIFLEQLRAMIRASAFGNVRIMVPMITTSHEWYEVKRLFSQALEQVDTAGQARAAHVPLGMMVEVPAAAIMSGLFAKHASFLSLGTNDLVQYTLAVDRMNPHLAHLASPFDPAILHLIRAVVASAQAEGKPLSVCGAMASDPLAAILLVGLGLGGLSMEPVAIPEIKETLHRVSLQEAKDVAEKALLQPSAMDVEHLLAVTFAQRLFDLLSGDETGGTGGTPLPGAVGNASSFPFAGALRNEGRTLEPVEFRCCAPPSSVVSARILRVFCAPSP